MRRPSSFSATRSGSAVQWRRPVCSAERCASPTRPHTIVGVMPEGFAFPIFHRAWVPLRLSRIRPATPGAGPSLTVFGRIADGYSLSQARAELKAIGERLAAAFPQSHARCPAARSRTTRRRSSGSTRPRCSSESALAAVRRRPPAPHRRGECRGSCVCAHRDTLWRDHRAEPRSAPLAAASSCSCSSKRSCCR